MARTGSNSSRGDNAITSQDVSDEVVAQVGKAVATILKLRQTLDETMATTQSDEERQELTEQVETAAVHAIRDQGLSVAEYNQVITAAQSDSELEQRVLVACQTA